MSSAVPAWEKGLLRRGPWIIALLFLAVTLPGLGSRDLWAPNEPNHAEAAREMVVDGHWLLPHINGIPYLEKPPLLHWLVAASWKASGSLGEGWARLPSVLGGLLGVLAAWGIGRRLGGDGLQGARTAFWSGLALATTGGWIWRARWIEPDALLAGLVAACLWLFLLGWCHDARWLLPSGLLLGLALMTKGPPALLPVLPAALGLAVRNASPAPRRWWWLAAGAAAAAALPVLWAGLASAFADYDLAQVLGRQIMERSGGLHHARPPWYYLSVGPVEALPLSLAAAGGVVLAMGGARRDAGDRFLLAWLLVPFLVFSLVTEKRGVYLLPLYPAAAILAGRLLACKETWQWQRRCVGWALWIGAALIGLLAVLLPVLAAREMPEAGPQAWSAALILGIGALAGFILGWGGRLRAGWAALSVATAVGIGAGAWGAAALDPEKSVRPFALEMAETAGDEPIWFYGRPRPAVHFYSGRTGPVLPHARDLPAVLEREGSILLVLDGVQMEETTLVVPSTSVVLKGRRGEKPIFLARVGGSPGVR